jgi:hypothetical protein
MQRYRTQGLLAVGLGILATGCFSEPDLKTGLRPEGPPEVLAVLLNETPTFCKYVNGVLDEKGPGLVQGSIVCPDEQAMFEPVGASPTGWNMRIMFDELLNGDAVETLENCNPQTDVCQGVINPDAVTLSCDNTVMSFTGHYYPNGNRETFPLGPSLFVSPDDLTASGVDCSLTINDVVVDKEGNSVATGAQVNAFTFSVDPITLLETDPADAEAVDDRAELGPTDAVTFVFNALIDEASIGAGDFALVNLGTNAVIPATVTVDADDPTLVFLEPDAALAPGNYSARLLAGATLTDLLGGTATIASQAEVRYVVPAP